MTHPKVTVTIDGVPVSGVFFERLISLTITGREGIQSDTLEMEFNDAPPHFASPRRGSVAKVSIVSGAAGGVFVGSFVINKVSRKCLPYTISVRGHSADMRAAMKASKARHWDDKTVKEIVTEIAGDHDLEAQISDVVSGHHYNWIGQTYLHEIRRVAYGTEGNTAGGINVCA